MKGDPATGRVVGLLFIVTGGIIALCGVIWLTYTTRFVASSTKAQGTVIAMDQSRASNGNTMYSPVYTFSDGSGIIHTQKTSMASSSFSFEVGEKVTILYDAATPKHSAIDSFQTVWFVPLFLTGFGLVFGGFASLWLYLWNRAARNQQFQDWT